MSNKANIEKSLKSLILDDGKEFVAMLSGEWGIGKTYFWNEFKTDYLKNKDVVYISLFGKNTLQDIETDIVTKLYKYNKNVKKYTKHLDNIGNLGSKALGLPFNISIGSVLSLFNESDFKNTVICFDDFERLSDKVALKDVLGLISLFKEQKECKIIMILNENELDKLSDIDGKKHNEIFSLYKEKVVDYNFYYQPSQEELFEAIKEDIVQLTLCDKETIHSFFRKIDLKNIRIMKQALYQLKHFDFIKDNRFDRKVVNEFVEITLNLFVFKAKSNYTYKDFSDMQKYTPYDDQVHNAKIYNDNETNIVKNEKHESNLKHYYLDTQSFTKEYKSINKDIIEKHVYDFMDNHTKRKEELYNLLKENHQSLQWYNVRNEISELHTRFYTDFSTQNSKIAKQLFNLLNEHKDDMHRLFQYNNFKIFIKNINKFSPDISTEKLERKIAENYIDFYIDNPNYDISGPIDREDGQSSLLTSDYDWAYTYINEYKKKTKKITPEEVFLLIANTLDSRYLSEDDAFKLNQISTKDYEKQIKENSNLIQPLVRFLKMPDSKDVRKNIINALKSLKKENDDDYAWKVEQISKSSGIIIEDEK